jgi:hypothetical protein
MGAGQVSCQRVVNCNRLDALGGGSLASIGRVAAGACHAAGTVRNANEPFMGPGQVSTVVPQRIVARLQWPIAGFVPWASKSLVGGVCCGSRCGGSVARVVGKRLTCCSWSLSRCWSRTQRRRAPLGAWTGEF